MRRPTACRSAPGLTICGWRSSPSGPKRIVGAGNLTSRHAAMQAGELEPDYLFFGRPHGDTHDAPHPEGARSCRMVVGDDGDAGRRDGRARRSTAWRKRRRPALTSSPSTMPCGRMPAGRARRCGQAPRRSARADGAPHERRCPPCRDACAGRLAGARSAGARRRAWSSRIEQGLEAAAGDRASALAPAAGIDHHRASRAEPSPGWTMRTSRLRPAPATRVCARRSIRWGSSSASTRG